NGGDYAFGALRVTGLGSEYEDSRALDTKGKTLEFVMNGPFDPNPDPDRNVMLKVGKAVDLEGSTVTLTFTPGTAPPGNLGAALLTLIDNTKKATKINASSFEGEYRVGDDTYGYARIEIDSTLAVYHRSVDAPGDWTAPSETYQADSANGPVSLMVGGTLLGVRSLALAKTGNNDLVFRVGTLEVTQKNGTLTLDGTAAGSAESNTGVFFGALAFSGGGELAVTRKNGGAFGFGGDLTVYGVRGSPAKYADPGGTLSANGLLTFHLPMDVAANGDDPMLLVTGAADIDGSEAALAFQGDGEPSLREGDAVALLTAEGGLAGKPKNSTATVSGKAAQGVTFPASDYEFDLAVAGKTLWATLRGMAEPVPNPQLKAISEGILTGLILANQGADLVAGAGLESAVFAGCPEGRYGVNVFGAASGGRQRYRSGSRVDVAGWSFLTGFSKGTDTPAGCLTLGAFFEYGDGSYDTFNTFANAAPVRGDGDVRYAGGGVLGRLDFSAVGPGRFYVEASGRAGRVKNGYRNPDMRDALGRGTGFDYSAPYSGLHAGGGYAWKLGAGTLDVYGKYFWTRQGGASMRLWTGDPIEFEASHSRRLRGGARFSRALGRRLEAYAGAGYEHEFGGAVRAASYGYDIGKPDIGGGGGLGEIGLFLKPSPSLPLSVDANVRGYLGRRGGAVGSVVASVEF
ncbi:MAG: hypothetical protein LBE84_00440, partial [Planctomycetota bacterium]|nr:hypothetical protein [Planctomycetota bacterium]